MIALNQTGYLPAAEKKAVLTKGKSFWVLDADNRAVLEKEASWFGFDEASGDEVAIADFSEIRSPGRYRLRDENGEESCTFEISERIYRALQKDLQKAFYYQRCGCALAEQYAGVYTHPACHTEKALLWEDNGVAKEVSGGWHDAGDYGRYISPAAVAVAHLLYAFKLFPESFGESVNIPESGNGVPDILNECRYELEWMLKMQREDGGVYHKLTSAMHADFVMPQEDTSPFYIFPVSSMATADYAACMALAAGVYRAYDEAFADRLLRAAVSAWGWLEAHPEYVGFHNPSNCNTGEYDDDCDRDERLWAAAELYLETGEEACKKALEELGREPLGKTDFGWTDVSGLASMAVLAADYLQTAKKAVPEKLLKDFRETVLAEAGRLVKQSESCGYLVAMAPGDYVWGSNMVVLNRGMLLVLAALLTEGEEKALYERVALRQLHYLLGTNAAGYSYVTGYGENACRHPHNRPTECDGIELPMPGWVSGGPFRTPCDETAVRSIPQGTPPMKCYLDHAMCYSLNEITIYWNSPAVFLTAYFNRS